MEAIEFVLGVLVVLVMLVDVFQTVVLPRPIIGSRLGIARALVYLPWRAWRRFCNSIPSPNVRERRLGLYAPATLIMLLALWIALLIVGYGLVLYAMRDQVDPVLRNLWEAFYLAGTSLLTIGFGDIVAKSAAARTVAVIAGGTGLVIVALAITFVFSLYAFFQRRELLVTTLDGRAGAPPSGVALLETHGRLGMVDDLARIFAAWELWSAEVLDSHLAYPLLGFFRSSHDNESWVSAVGAHLVEDVTAYFSMTHEHGAGVERSEFDEARARLTAAGFRLREPEASWSQFSTLRGEYAGDLNAMASFWSVPPAQWIGDRSTLRHTEG